MAASFCRHQPRTSVVVHLLTCSAYKQNDFALDCFSCVCFLLAVHFSYFRRIDFVFKTSIPLECSFIAYIQSGTLVTGYIQEVPSVVSYSFRTIQFRRSVLCSNFRQYRVAHCLSKDVVFEAILAGLSICIKSIFSCCI